MKKSLLAIIMIGAFLPLFSQESILKDFASGRSEREFCLYPSTLRMINLARDPSYDKLVSDIRKLLLYRIYKTDLKEYTSVLKEYEAEGFEEYIKIYGGDQNFVLLGKEGFRNDQMVGIANTEMGLFAFYLKGNVDWGKIPTLLNKLNNANSSFDFFSLDNMEKIEID